jgi:hypothetical protein
MTALMIITVTAVLGVLTMVHKPS